HIVPRRTQHERAHTEALRQFFAQGLHQTENRTGVLIFASLAERYAEIVADAGINAKVTPQVWDQAIAALIAGMKQGRAGDGVVASAGGCVSLKRCWTASDNATAITLAATRSRLSVSFTMSMTAGA